MNIKKKIAFTLVELIIVIAIITLLAGVVVITIQPQSLFSNSRNSQRTTDLNTIQNAISRYIADSTNSQPKAITDFGGFEILYEFSQLTAPSGVCVNGTSSINSTVTGSFDLDIVSGSNKINLSALINNGYLPKLPKDPTNNFYQACIDTQNGNQLVLFAPNTEKLSSFFTTSVGKFSTTNYFPNKIANLQLWLKAYSLPNTTTNVSSWTDSSNNNYSTTQSTPGNQPTYVSNVINSEPAIRFSGNQFLSSNVVTPTGNAGRTIFVVVKNISNNGATFNHILHYGSTGTGQAYGLASRVANSNVFGNHYWSWYMQSSQGTTGNSYILTINYDGANDNIFVNGASAGTNNVALNTGSGYNLKIGSRLDGAAEFFNGDIAEILFYNSSLSTSDRQSIEGYLNGKYLVY